ncbi:predicted protein [Botrytis cinerea T4]|uniref:Uncharacterized protein n=1 Tax=Botryotinia fuckeliana (strain T4) TaxID=999810 RepID=G2Y7P7_BOTF4|nr:predicted protein [Botrytis cinerea T4]
MMRMSNAHKPPSALVMQASAQIAENEIELTSWKAPLTQIGKYAYPFRLHGTQSMDQQLDQNWLVAQHAFTLQGQCGKTMISAGSSNGVATMSGIEQGFYST